MRLGFFHHHISTLVSLGNLHMFGTLEWGCLIGERDSYLFIIISNPPYMDYSLIAIIIGLVEVDVI